MNYHVFFPLRRFVILFIVGACFLGAYAAKAETLEILFRSKRGSLLAVGEILLDEKLPKSGAIRATYRLQLRTAPHTDKEVDWFFRLFEGKLQGKVEWKWPDDAEKEGLSHFNFMPGTADANIFAAVKCDPEGVGRGSWSYAIFAGGWEGGAFEIRKP